MKIGQIEKGIEPSPSHWRRKYPFHNMKINDSIHIEGTEQDIDRVCKASHSYATRTDKKFRYRKSDNKLSVRIFRVS